MENSMNNLVIKYLQGECAGEEIKQVEEWKNASAQNLNDFNAVKRVIEAGKYVQTYYNTLDVEKELERNLKSIETREKENPLNVFQDETGLKKLKVFIRYAAIIIISLGIGSFISWKVVSSKYQSYWSSGAIHEVVAPKGARSIALLPDGTKVWLNAGTKLTYNGAYGINERNVTLEGEAYFKVKTNPKKPFTVITSELKIRAYGTAFNVKAYPEEKNIITTLEEGKVKITGNGVDISLKPKQNLLYERRLYNEPLKTEPSSATVSASNAQKAPVITTQENIDTDIFTAWKDNRWIIESASLVEIEALLERKFNVVVNVKSEDLLKYKFRGIFTNETLEQILDVFRYTAPLKYKIEKGIVTIELDKNRSSNYEGISTHVNY